MESNTVDSIQSFLFQLWCFQTQTLLFFTFLTALLPSLCYAPFSPRFTAGLQGRGTCLLTLSPEGAGKKAGNHNEQICSCKLTPAEGVCGLFVGVCETRSWRTCRDRWALILQLLYSFHMCKLTEVTAASSQTGAGHTHRHVSAPPGEAASVQCPAKYRAGQCRSLKWKNILMYSYVFVQCTALCQLCPDITRYLLFQYKTNVWIFKLLMFCKPGSV